MEISRGIVIGKWDDTVGLDIISEYPNNFRASSNVKDPDLLNIFNDRIVKQNIGFEICSNDYFEDQIASYYTPNLNGLYEETDIQEHGIVFLILNKDHQIESYKEQFIEFSMFILKLVDKDEFPELFLNIIDNFSFLEPLSEEQRFAAIYNNEIREQFLKRLAEGPISQSELLHWLETTYNMVFTDVQGLLSPFVKTNLIKQTFESTQAKKKEAFYYLIKDVYLFRIPPKEILDTCKKGNLPALTEFSKDYQEEVVRYFEEYELTPADITKISLLLAIPNLYKIIKLLREYVYEMDELRIDFLERFNYLPSNFNYLLNLLEQNEIIKVFKKDKKKIYFLKTDIQFQLFFPEYLVDNIRKAWRENELSKKIALKHLSMLRDEYFENFMSFANKRKEKGAKSSGSTSGGSSSKALNFLKLLKFPKK